MDTWLLLLISGGVPAIITVAGPHLSARLKARQVSRKTDAEIGAAIRDELREEIERRDEEIAVLRRRIGALETWALRLEGKLREMAPDVVADLRRDYLEEAAG